MRLTIIESPYAGTPEEIERNTRYLRACLAHSLSLGEAPFASHAIYTQPGVLRDEVPDERIRGIEAGLAWAKRAEGSAIYIDLGVSRGMVYGIEHAVANDRPIEVRALPHGVLLRALGTRALDPLPGRVESVTAAWRAIDAARVKLRGGA